MSGLASLVIGVLPTKDHPTDLRNTTMTTEAEVMCPKCGGRTWDNRETKKNPKAPDYKCRDKACDGVVWPPKPGSAAPRSAAPAPAAKQAYSSGPALPYEQETGAPPHVESGSVHQKLDKMFSVYDVCLDHAHAVAKRQFGNDVTDTAVAAMTATLFIAAKEGLR